MTFQEKLISLRKAKGLSQEELGAELHVSRQTISKWESGQSYPDFQRLVLLSDYFELTLDQLVKDVDVQEVRQKIWILKSWIPFIGMQEKQKRFNTRSSVLAGGVAVVVLALMLYFIIHAVYIW